MTDDPKRREEALSLLSLTAEIARAGTDPGRWPSVLDQIGDWLQCPSVFGNRVADETVRATVLTAGECARSSVGVCGKVKTADEPKRLTCLAFVGHLELAVASRQESAMLDILARPLYRIEEESRLLHSNALGPKHGGFAVAIPPSPIPRQDQNEDAHSPRRGKDFMSAFQIYDRIKFRTLTPDGPFVGNGQIIKIFPAGQSHWLHVKQDDGSVRMLLEATTTVEVVGLEAA